MPQTGVGYRYPADTDPTQGGAVAIQHLAEDCERLAGVGASGQVTIHAANVSMVSATVTFATDTVDGVAGVPRFTAPPAVIVACGNYRYWFGSVASITATSCVVYLRQYQNANATIDAIASWHARQDVI